MNTNRLIKTLEKHEGFRSDPYLCSGGKLTIGIGRNLTDKGITYSEARFLLKNDLDDCRWDLAELFNGFDAYSDHVQEVLMNMRFQLGPRGFRSFKNFIAAIKAWDFKFAQKEMLYSLWAEQTPNRAKYLSEVLISGFDEN